MKGRPATILSIGLGDTGLRYPRNKKEKKGVLVGRSWSVANNGTILQINTQKLSAKMTAKSLDTFLEKFPEFAGYF